MDFDQKTDELGIALPPAPTPAGNYLPCVESQGHLFISGQVPRIGREIKFKGSIGDTLNIEEGYDAARLCALNALGVAKGYLGTLNRIKKVVKLSGFVRSAPGFQNQPRVVDGASDFLVSIFGDQGKHARVAVGVNELPGESAVEIEVLLELTGP
jgi:enamine deaminase RidA (YjgF/YER057c/UK114 family)